MSIALVTAANSGIGSAVVHKLRSSGIETIACIRQNGDLTKEEDVKNIFENLNLKILVCCAGVNEHGNPVDTNILEFDKMMHDNLTTAILPCQYAARTMMKERKGHIVTVGSYAGCFGRPTGVAYSVAKAALHEYTRCLAAYLRPYNICVNCVAPGNIMTPRFMKEYGSDNNTNTLDRYGYPEEIADVVVGLCQNTFVSGQIIRVDGGKHTF